ncbi:hypothetical protein CDD83_456 [Cordyceps sp. RAO-2017]|nr:hypothetical protein CDD83_456 [Cordyceps sp. RAO-2017]
MSPPANALLHLLRLLLLLLQAVPAMADYDQASRCYVADDAATRDIVPEMLANATRCSAENPNRRVLACIERQVPHEAMDAVLPLLQTVRIWERFYGFDLNTAFAEHGKMLHESWFSRIGVYDPTAWEVLEREWRHTGRLCFYDSDPRSADHIRPRFAGLLTLFFMDKDLRPPVLNFGERWEYAGRTGCSAQTDDDKARQLRILTDMHKAGATEESTAIVRDRIGSFYRNLYSTDPFIQAVITGWQNGPYGCPDAVSCMDYIMMKSVYLPTNSGDFIDRILYALRMQQKVCVLFRAEPLRDATYYIAAENGDSSSTR